MILEDYDRIEKIGEGKCGCCYQLDFILFNLIKLTKSTDFILLKLQLFNYLRYFYYGKNQLKL